MSAGGSVIPAGYLSALMATFDQLSAEQRAIIELVLKRGQTYQQLSEMLGMPTVRVRELARESLVRLSPVSAAAVDDDWRGQIADYLLNQQTGPESTATKGHLRRSEAARGWSRSVLDSLDEFYEADGLPAIPEGDPAAGESKRRREPRRERSRRDKKDDDKDAEAAPASSRRSLSPAASEAVRRRRLVAGGGAAALLVLLLLFVWPSPGNMGPLALGDDSEETADGGGGADDTQNAATQTRLVGQLALTPVESTEGQKNVRGVAVIAQRGGERQLIVQAQLPRNKDGQAYQVWLYNSDGDARSLGAQVADRNGAFQGAGPLPEGFDGFQFIDVSREDIRGDDGHGGDSVLRGRLDQVQAPPQDPAGQGDAQGGAAPEQAAPQPTPQTPAQP